MTAGHAAHRVEAVGLPGMPEVRAGDNLCDLVWACLSQASGFGTLADGDIVVITSKVVSKAEGRRLPAARRDEAIESETVRVVAQRGDTRIVETRHGLVLAAAGVDTSNVDTGSVLLLPVDPDESARRIRRALAAHAGVVIAVVITDTAGRPWRNGLVDLAIGAAGLQVLDDHRSKVDAYGNRLRLTVTAVADEVAALTELVMGKTSQIPVAVVRALGRFVTDEDGPGARALVRPAEEDLFRFGAVDEGMSALRVS